MTMTKKHLFFIVLSLVLVLASITSITLAWLSFNGYFDNDIDVGDFNGELVFKFNSDSGDVEAPSSVFNEYGLLSINGISKDQVTDSTGDYYIDDLKVSLNIDVESVAYLRIKVMDQWLVTRTYTSIDREYSEVINHEADELFPFKLTNDNFEVNSADNPTKWYFDANTGYVYYTEMLEVGSYTLPFIYGGYGYIPKVSISYYDTCQLLINFRVEVVQANRYQEVWNITDIPSGGNNG